MPYLVVVFKWLSVNYVYLIIAGVGLFAWDMYKNYEGTQAALAKAQVVNAEQVKTIATLQTMAALEAKITQRTEEVIRTAYINQAALQKSLDLASKNIQKAYANAKTSNQPACVDPGFVPYYDWLRDQLRLRSSTGGKN